MSKDILASLLADVDTGGGLAWPTRFLIVDDAASTRRFLRTVLECCPQFEVAGEADNGATAVTVAEALQPDVVLLDLSMPVSDGAEALANLQRVVPKALVIMLSGTNRQAAPPLLAAGATAFISKGLAPFELLEQLGSILLEHLPPPVALPIVAPVASMWEADLSLAPAPSEHTAIARSSSAVIALPESESTEPMPRFDMSTFDHLGNAGTAAAPSGDAHEQPRAIVCDDDPLSRHLVGQVVNACGVVVVADTDTVPNLLSVVEMTRPDLVVLDLWLEGTSGTSAIPEIKRLSPGTLVLVYSAHHEWERKALDAGATAFVAKPAFEELESEIERLLSLVER